VIPPPTITKVNPEFEREVDKRAVALCKTHSEDGTFDYHCPDIPAHWQEARRQLLEAWQQENA
jgi:hypothetical protein